MSAPIPKEALTGHCSAINNNTLYVLSPNAFQSLPLKENATWSSLPTGESVTGAACTVAQLDGDELQSALYVIGGTSSDDSYGGMQRYVFSTQKWETLTPLTTDMKGRTDHSIAYLNGSAAILVYAGSQPQAPSTLSSQTFLISVGAPYEISAFTSTAPPANLPILLPWDSTHAVMLGGQEDNKRIFTFGQDDGWQALDTNLTTALSTGVGAALVSGSDGSKVLQVYDASTSPNQVQNIVLLEAGGKTASNGQTIGGSSSSSSRKRKRDLTLSNWPDYNSTDAPTVKRSDYSVAQSSDGLTVISGGGSDDEPLNIFNQEKNAWVENSVFFGDSSNQVPLTSATASATSSSTASSTGSAASATSSVPAGLTKSTSNHTRRTLGITLGVLAGIAILLAVALICMRRRKNQQKKQQQAAVDEKDADRLSFADRGASFMKEAGGSVADLGHLDAPPAMGHLHNGSQSSIAMFGAGKPNTQRTDIQNQKLDNLTLLPPANVFHDKDNSHSSLMIIAGKIGTNRHSRNEKEKGSFDSTARLVKSPSADAKSENGLELKEINTGAPNSAIDRKPVGQGQQDMPIGGDYDQESLKKRSSGWSKYFAPGEDNIYQSQHANSSGNLSMSQYTVNSRMPSSLNVPPLDIAGFNKDLEGQRLSAVVKGRPSFNHSAEDLAARGASPDSVRPQAAAFHTGNSVERDGYLNDRDSFEYQGRPRSASSMSSRVTSSVFFGGSGASAWTPDGRVMSAGSLGGNGASAIKEIQIPPRTLVSPRMGQLQHDDSSSSFVRAPSSTYSASIAPGRDSNMPFAPEELPGQALSPSTEHLPTIPNPIPGPAARAAAKGPGNPGFFPSSNETSRLPPRKIGALHPGTLAAISYNSGANRDQNDNKGVTQKYLEEKERLAREREKRDKNVASGGSEYSWLKLDAQA